MILHGERTTVYDDIEEEAHTDWIANRPDRDEPPTPDLLDVFTPKASGGVCSCPKFCPIHPPF